MARVHHVKKARKDNAVVKKGESYYWWEFRNSGKKMSATKPTRSQLTQSAFKQTYYGLQDRIEGMRKLTLTELENEHPAIVSEIDNLAEEAQESLENVPESMQESHMLNGRIESLEEWGSGFENVDVEVDTKELEPGLDGEDLSQEEVNRIVDELIDSDPGIE